MAVKEADNNESNRKSNAQNNPPPSVPKEPAFRKIQDSPSSLKSASRKKEKPAKKTKDTRLTEDGVHAIAQAALHGSEETNLGLSVLVGEQLPNIHDPTLKDDTQNEASERVYKHSITAIGCADRIQGGPIVLSRIDPEENQFSILIDAGYGLDEASKKFRGYHKPKTAEDMYDSGLYPRLLGEQTKIFGPASQAARKTVVNVAKGEERPDYLPLTVEEIEAKGRTLPTPAGAVIEIDTHAHLDHSAGKMVVNGRTPVGASAPTKMFLDYEDTRGARNNYLTIKEIYRAKNGNLKRRFPKLARTHFVFGAEASPEEDLLNSANKKTIHIGENTYTYVPFDNPLAKPEEIFLKTNQILVGRVNKDGEHANDSLITLKPVSHSVFATAVEVRMHDRRLLHSADLRDGKETRKMIEGEKEIQKREGPLDVLSTEFTKGSDYTQDFGPKKLYKFIKEEIESTDGRAFITFSRKDILSREEASRFKIIYKAVIAAKRELVIDMAFAQLLETTIAELKRMGADDLANSCISSTARGIRIRVPPKGSSDLDSIRGVSKDERDQALMDYAKKERKFCEYPNVISDKDMEANPTRYVQTMGHAKDWKDLKGQNLGKMPKHIICASIHSGETKRFTDEDEEVKEQKGRMNTVHLHDSGHFRYKGQNGRMGLYEFIKLVDPKILYVTHTLPENIDRAKSLAAEFGIHFVDATKPVDLDMEYTKADELRARRDKEERKYARKGKKVKNWFHLFDATLPPCIFGESPDEVARKKEVRRTFGRHVADVFGK